MMKYRIFIFGLLCGLLCAPIQEGAAKKREKKSPKTENVVGKEEKGLSDTTKTVVKKGATPYDKIFKGKKNHVCKKGFITIHLIDQKIWLEIPYGVFGRDLLVSSWIDRTSDVGALSPGLSASSTKRFRIDRTDSLVLFRQPKYNVLAENDDTRIEQALDLSNIGPIMYAFPIAANDNDSTSVVIDASSFFQAGNKDILDLRGTSMGNGSYVYESALIPSAAKIDKVDAFENSLTVASEVGLRLTLGSWAGILAEKPEVSIGLVSSLTLLPEEEMQTRKADPRIGTAYVSYTSFSENGSKPGYFAGRWDLKMFDPFAPSRGELSEPIEPITFYIDTLFRESWVEAIRQGIASWNAAFEKAGFKNAIRAVPYPSDSSFRADDPMISRVVFAPATSSTVRVHRIADPRSGEIMSARITVPRDFVEGVRQEGIYTMANADRRFAGYNLSDEVICEALRATIMRQTGICLGLATNYAGSWAYTTEQLRDPQFTQQYGITSSVTDPVLFNYAARPGDRERGVVMISRKPGIYDEFVIKWLYTPLGDNEQEILDQWLAEKSNDPYYFYGKAQRLSYSRDPRALSGDLGSNIFDVVDNHIENLKYVIANAPGWLTDDSIPEVYKELFPDFIFLKLNDCFNYLSKYIGGIYQGEPRVENVAPVNRPVPAALQRKAMQKILEMCEDMTWLDANRDLLWLGGPNRTISDLMAMQAPCMTLMYSTIPYMALSVEKSDDPYTQEEALDDLANFIFRNVKKGKPLSKTEIFHIGQYVANLIGRSPVMSANLKKARSAGQAFAGDQPDFFAELTEQQTKVAELRSRFAAHSLFAEVSDDLLTSDMMEEMEPETMEGMGPRTSIYYYYPKNIEPVYFECLKSARKDVQRAINLCANEMDRGNLRYFLSMIDMALTGK